MTSSNVAVRLLVSGGVLLGLALSGNGLIKMVYIERTPGAVSLASTGQQLLALGCAVLIVCAAVAFGAGPHWAAVLIATPAVVCGGLALVTEETLLLPQIAALPTFALAVAGAVGFLLKRSSG